MPILVLNSINKCNADCIYCNTDKKGKSKRIGIELINTLYYKINEYLSENINASVEIQWHGGEPLLLGSKFFNEACKLQNQICKKTQKRIQHSIQSNLTLLNQDFIKAFTKLGLKSIGTSAEFHSSIRMLKNNEDEYLYNKKFFNALKILEVTPFTVGINYVVTKKSLLNPEMVFYYLTNINPRGIISFNPVIINDKSLQYLEILPEEFNSFIQQLFSIWKKNITRYSSMEPFYTLWKTGESLSGNKTLDNNTEIPVILNTNGEYYHFKRPAAILGNINTDSIVDILGKINKKNDELFKSVDSRRKCKSCKLLKWCAGNLNMDSYSQNDSIDNDARWCEARKDIVFNFVLSKN